MVDPKPEPTNEISTDENISFSSVDSFMPSFNTTDSLVSSFNSVPNLTIDALSTDSSMNSQYTIENLEQNISCENLDQSMNSIEDTSQDIENGNSNISNVIPDTDNSENSENSESPSESNEQKTDLSNIEKDASENSHLQINSLPTDSSNNQINSASSEVTPLEMNSLSGDMTGIIQIPYSANGLQIIPISGGANNLFNFSTNSGFSYPIQIGHISSDDASALTYSSTDGAVSDIHIDSSQLTFASDNIDSTQLDGFSIKVNQKQDIEQQNVQSNQISSEMSREEMESAMDESCTSLMEGI